MLYEVITILDGSQQIIGCNYIDAGVQQIGNNDIANLYRRFYPDFRQSAHGDKYRITSYNVCYTKLLRDQKYALCPIEPKYPM